MKISEVTGQFIIDYCKEHDEIAWLKKTSAKNRNFIALRSAFVNKFDEFKDLRPKVAKKPLWKIIEEM